MAVGAGWGGEGALGMCKLASCDGEGKRGERTLYTVLKPFPTLYVGQTKIAG